MAEYIVEMPFAWIYNETKGIKHESIVRCRDCKHATVPVDWDGLPIKEMEGWLDCLGKLTTGWDYYDDEPRYNLVEPDGFCAWGERK